MFDNAPQRRFAIHGFPVEIDCAVIPILEQLTTILGGFAVANLPRKFASCSGSICSYDPDEVIRHLSSEARLVARTPELVEIYEDDERVWIVDDRWGISEVNVLKSTWRSWVIDSPCLDDYRCFEMTVLWPLAQLLGSRGLHLVPALGMARGQHGVLVISPFGLDQEVHAMINAGYRVIGQRWTALREENKNFLMLHLPGRMEKPVRPHLRNTLAAENMWVDIARVHPDATQGFAVCEKVLVAAHGRRPRAYLREVEQRQVAQRLSAAWPIPLHPSRRAAHAARDLSRVARCFDVQLSQEPSDLLTLLAPTRRPILAA